MKLVGGAGVRHPQQGLRQHHQREALLGREREFAQHVLDAAERIVVGADGLDQARRGAVDPRSCAASSRAVSSSRAAMTPIVRRIGRRERRQR